MKEHPSDRYSGKNDFQSMEIGEKILLRSSRFKIPDGKTREEALADFKKKIALKEKEVVIPVRAVRSRRLILWVSSAAAVILLLFGIRLFSSLVSEVKVTAGRGQHTGYILPDGSEIRLNAESHLAFTKKNFAKERTVNFKGEGFFNVKKGGAFTIITPKGEIRVLGTSFNIQSRNDIFRVACLTGKIMVSSGNQSLIIEPGESAELSGNNLKSFRDTKIEYVTGWINGEFYFENSPLDLVFDEIERQFNVKFATRERENRYFTGSFTNKNLEEALETVCIVMRLKYEIGENEKIYIRNKE